MGNIIQFILGNPILIVILLGGVFNVGVRFAQKAKEQRAKRAAIARFSVVKKKRSVPVSR